MATDGLIDKLESHIGGNLTDKEFSKSFSNLKDALECLIRTGQELKEKGVIFLKMTKKEKANLSRALASFRLELKKKIRLNYL